VWPVTSRLVDKALKESSESNHERRATQTSFETVQCNQHQGPRNDGRRRIEGGYTSSINSSILHQGVVEVRTRAPPPLCPPVLHPGQFLHLCLCRPKRLHEDAGGRWDGDRRPADRRQRG
jgi:hypothetical protein